MINEHCREHHGEMRNPVSRPRFARSFINDDVNLFASKWYDAAISPKTTGFAQPNVIGDLPPVVTIEWTKTPRFIGMGGVGMAVYYRPIRAGDRLLSPSKRPRGCAAGLRGY